MGDGNAYIILPDTECDECHSILWGIGAASVSFAVGIAAPYIWDFGNWVLSMMRRPPQLG